MEELASKYTFLVKNFKINGQRQISQLLRLKVVAVVNETSFLELKNVSVIYSKHEKLTSNEV